MKKFLLPLCLLSVIASAQEPESFTRPPEASPTPNVQPRIANGVAEPCLTAEFLYWKVREDGLEYAVKGLGDTSSPVTNKGRLYEPDFKGEPGFRVGLGLNMVHDGWDLLLQYTWMQTHVKDHVSGDPSNDIIQPVWVHAPNSFLNGGLTRASSNWDLRMNVLDLEWGRNFYISRFLTLRPFFGFKAFWSKQDDHIRYDGFVDQGQTQVGANRIFLKQDAWGFGARMGLDTAWYFVRNWSAYADMALTAAWAKYDVDRRDRGIDTTSGAETVLVNVQYDRYTMTPIMELGVGLRWEMWFNQDSYHALIQAGWEEQIWWDFTRLYHIFSPNAVLGNLQFQGLSLKFQFDF